MANAESERAPVAVQAARENKNDTEKTRLLGQGNEFLSQASKSAPSDQS